jgi:tetratricopeptide (TPR) repeat protein
MQTLPSTLEVKLAMAQCNRDELLTIANQYDLSQYQSNSLGNAFRSINELDLAERYFLKSIALDPSYDEPYGNLISLYAQQGKFDACNEIYKLGSRNAAKKTFIMYQDGRVHFLQGDYQTSLFAGRCILIDDKWQNEDAIAMVIKSILMLIRAGQSENIDADFEEAETACKRGLLLFPDSEQLKQLSGYFVEAE